jgi:hypothetical protein
MLVNNEVSLPFKKTHRKVVSRPFGVFVSAVLSAVPFVIWPCPYPSESPPLVWRLYGHPTARSFSLWKNIGPRAKIIQTCVRRCPYPSETMRMRGYPSAFDSPFPGFRPATSQHHMPCGIPCGEAWRGDARGPAETFY